jgi:hypothetical protein
MKTEFEQIGGSYTKVGDYYLPNLALPADEEKNIILGRFGMAHKACLKINKPVLYSQPILILPRFLYTLSII